MNTKPLMPESVNETPGAKLFQQNGLPQFQEPHIFPKCNNIEEYPNFLQFGNTFLHICRKYYGTYHIEQQAYIYRSHRSLPPYLTAITTQ